MPYEMGAVVWCCGWTAETTLGGKRPVTQAKVFQRFEIRPDERILLVEGKPVGIGARAFDVLLALAERHHRVVSKAELLDLAWPGIVVEENNLSVQISALRRLLGHDAVRTVMGRGYQLKSTVSAPVPAAGQGSTGEGAAPTIRLQRRLAAIVQADVVGWARLVDRDPTLAATTWKRIRVELIERTVPQFGGRPIELTADRMQLEFASAVEAVAWALEVQGQMSERRLTTDPSESQSVHLRIGIAVDDVIVDDGKLVGDGVNLASDLQLSAGHDEILTTEKVRDLVAHKISVGFYAMGERLMRQSGRPMPVFCVVKSTLTSAVASVRPAGIRVASVAVMPFGTEGPPGEAYFGDGITEEIIASLSLNRALFVIAHNSTLRYRGKDVDPTAIAGELGVRYLVIGSVRRAEPKVRIHVSLMHAADQRILWQQPFEGVVEDLFEFQSEIAAKVAAAVAPQVQDEEVARVRHRPTDSYDAYDCVLRALAGVYQLGTPEFDMAGEMLQRAIQFDPGYAQAHAHLAWWYSVRDFEGRAPRGGHDGRRALDHAFQATRLDARDAWVLSVAGYMLSLRKKHAQSLELFEQALTLNPSCAAAWARSAATLSYLGRTEESLQRLQRAMKLSPFDPHMFWHLTICGGACFVAGRYDEATGWLGKALRLNPRFNGARRVQIAALVRTGELTEARDLAQELLADCPEFSITEFGQRSPMQQPYLENLLGALRQAGLPD
jgi:adenylate cyclase